jgi:hypothetical protein
MSNPLIPPPYTINLANWLIPAVNTVPEVLRL